jgi:hypothetical protein
MNAASAPYDLVPTLLEWREFTIASACRLVGGPGSQPRRLVRHAPAEDGEQHGQLGEILIGNPRRAVRQHGQVGAVADRQPAASPMACVAVGTPAR